MTIKRFDDLQLRFNLDLDAEEEDARERVISAEEARQISEAARLSLISRRDGLFDESPAWMEDYLRLVEHGWPWRVACYIAWAAAPKRMRCPETLAELATAVLGLTGPRVIHTWRRKYPAIDQTVAMMQAAPLFEHRRDVIDALVAAATNPDYKFFNDRRLFLEMIADYTPKSKLELGGVKANNLAELSDDELDALIGENGPETAGGMDGGEDKAEPGGEYAE